jgi:hypothetical protein
VQTLHTVDGRYLVVEQDGDENLVVYLLNPDGTLGPAAWDRFSHESSETVGAGHPSPPAQPPPPAVIPPSDPPAGGGGVLTSSVDPTVRPRLSAAQMAGFLPHKAGPFTFPAPYGTRGIRLTSERDGMILPVGYSDRPNVNQHAHRDDLLVFLGTVQGWPILLSVNKASGKVEHHGRIGNLRGTGELWYFSSTDPQGLYYYNDAGFWLTDVITGRSTLIFSVDPQQMLWQMSSSDDDQTHAGTVRDAVNYHDLGCVVFRHGRQRFFPKRDGYDECQIDKSGRYLVIKEGQGDNRVVDLDTNEERTLRNADGAVGHSDVGRGVMVGEDDQHEPCALVRWDLRQPLTPERRQVLYHTLQWVDEQGRGLGLGHVAVRGDRILVSHAHPTDYPRVNELILVAPDGSGLAVAVAPNLMTLEDHQVPVPYELQVKANIDPAGQYVCWTANAGQNRLDAFLLQVP